MIIEVINQLSYLGGTTLYAYIEIQTAEATARSPVNGTPTPGLVVSFDHQV